MSTGASGAPPGGGTSEVGVALVYPELLGTYGDGGNASILARRLRWRGISARVVTVTSGEAVPRDASLYVLGGGEDGPQVRATRELERDGGLGMAVDNGAVVLAVCAGMQIVGRSFPDGHGGQAEGLGLLDCETIRTDEPRAIGELWARSHPDLDLGDLTGYENHGGRTLLGSSATPLGTVVAGVGNGSPSITAEGVATEGACHLSGKGTVVGTYLHGPCLARNPALADKLLEWAMGSPMPPLEDEHAVTDREASLLRAERLATVRGGHIDGVAHRSLRDRLLRRN